MTDDQKTTLISDVKNDLDISWEDEATNKKIKEYVENGIVTITGISSASEEINFSLPGKERELLFAYCRYARSNVLEMFRKNFKDELISIRLKYKTKRVILNES